MCCLLTACGSKGDLRLPDSNPTELETSREIPISVPSQENSKPRQDPALEKENERSIL